MTIFKAADIRITFIKIYSSYIFYQECGYCFSKHLSLGMYPHFLWLFKEYLTELKDQLRFHDHLLNHVEEWKKSIRKSNSKSIKFIGVHCRRTDYANHYKVVSGATLVDHHFFDTAFDIYRRKYNGDNVKVIFLAVSDDNDWIKVNDYTVVATSTCSGLNPQYLFQMLL